LIDRAENPSERRSSLTILTVLLAFFADAVMNSVASTRQNYLVEFGRYLDTRYPAGSDRDQRPQ